MSSGPAEAARALAEAIASGGPPAAETLNMACFWISRSLDGVDFKVSDARGLARLLLRAGGRTIIDAAGTGADPDTWPGTEEQVLLWLDEALRKLGYRVAPLPESGRPELPDPSAGWS